MSGEVTPIQVAKGMLSIQADRKSRPYMSGEATPTQVAKR